MTSLKFPAAGPMIRVGGVCDPAAPTLAGTVPTTASEVDPRKTRRDRLPFVSTDPGRLPPEGGHLSRTATVNPTPAGAADAPVAARPPLPPALQRACLAAKVAAENKGQDVLVLDLRHLTPLFDYFVLSTGASRRQVHTIVEETDAALRAVGDARSGIEGYEASKWIVQDFGDLLVHVFDADTRAYYRLEDLWADAVKVDWEDEIE